MQLARLYEQMNEPAKALAMITDGKFIHTLLPLDLQTDTLLLSHRRSETYSRRRSFRSRC